MDPVIGGALIGAGANILGGLMGRRSNREQVDRSVELQRDFAQHGVQWKVEDAKRAGLHPVYALGAATSGPTIPVMDDPLARSIQDAGQTLGKAASSGLTQDQKDAAARAGEVHLAQIRRLNSEAAMFDSITVKNYRDLNANPAFPEPARELLPGQGNSGGNNSVVVSQRDALLPGNVGVVEVKPNPNISPRSVTEQNVTAGANPYWDLVTYGKGQYPFKILLPRSQEGPTESWYELSLLEKARVLAFNYKNNPDPRWAERAALELGFIPKQSYPMPAPNWVQYHNELVDMQRRDRDTTPSTSGRQRGINWKTGR